ncbi:hypothetical protein Pla175_46210 [Pirellulimonas nuda]|uniref:Uncharacterized protein n=1 Tax=Pirellulimonas nuda TaxID=2528009 RepID=A0A518DI91_9BACT|nr:hypothetical protein Pla175_46210 [Pirellulimonas nuda]
MDSQQLPRAEPFYEIPLDNIVCGHLKRLSKNQRPFPWSTIKALTPENSAILQGYASSIAEKRGTFPVHLDAVFWIDRSPA